MLLDGNTLEISLNLKNSYFLFDCVGQIPCKELNNDTMLIFGHYFETVFENTETFLELMSYF